MNLIYAIRSSEATTGINDSILNMSLGSDFECPPSSPQIESSENEFTVNTVLVLEVLRQEASNGGNLYRPEKLLRLFDEETSQEAICILREDWEGMEVCPGDSVHITGKKELKFSDYKFWGKNFRTFLSVFRLNICVFSLSHLKNWQFNNDMFIVTEEDSASKK